MRRLSALCLIAAPVLLLTSELLSPALSDDGAESLAVVAAQPDRLAAWIWLGIAVRRPVRPRRRRGRRPAAAAGRRRGVATGPALAVVGAFGYAVHQGLFLQLPTLLDGDPAEMAAALRAAGRERGVRRRHVPAVPGAAADRAAAARDRAVPVAASRRSGRRSPSRLAILPSAVPLPVDTGFLPFVLMIAGMGGWAWAVLRTPEEQLAPSPCDRSRTPRRRSERGPVDAAHAAPGGREPRIGGRAPLPAALLPRRGRRGRGRVRGVPAVHRPVGGRAAPHPDGGRAAARARPRRVLRGAARRRAVQLQRSAGR